MAEEVKTQEAPEETSGAQTQGVEKTKERTFSRDEVNKMIAAEKKKAIAEAERLSNMTAGERAKEKMAQAVRARNEEITKFNQEKEAFEREKLEMQTSKELLLKKLPAEFASFITGKDAETTKKNLDEFEKQYRKSIELSVNEKMRGGEPPKVAPSTSNEKADRGFSKPWNKNKK